MYFKQPHPLYPPRNAPSSNNIDSRYLPASGGLARHAPLCAGLLCRRTVSGVASAACSRVVYGVPSRACRPCSRPALPARVSCTGSGRAESLPSAQSPLSSAPNLFFHNSTVPYRHVIAGLLAEGELAPTSDINALEWLNIASTFMSTAFVPVADVTL